MPMNKISPRIAWIDIAKCILIFFVFYGHVEKIGDTVSMFIFAFHMPAFFVLSGYTFHVKERGFLAFFKKNLKGTLLPYFLFAGLFLVVRVIEEGRQWIFTYDTFQQLLIRCAPDAFYIGAGWFLIALFWSRIWMYYYVDKLKKYRGGVRAAFLLIIFYIATSVLDINKSWGIDRMPWRLDSSLMGFFFMAIGYEIHRYDFTKFFEMKKGIMLPLLLVFCVATKANHWVNMADCFYYDKMLYFLESMSGSFLIFILSIRFADTYMGSVFQYIGRYTLSLFMIHGFFLHLMITKLHISVMQTPHSWIALLISILLFLFVIPFAIVVQKGYSCLVSRLP